MLVLQWCGDGEVIAEQHITYCIDLWKKNKNCEKCETWKEVIDPCWNHAD